LTSATEKVLRFIENRGYAGRNEILEYNWRHVSAEDLDRVIATLREAGVISERYVGKKTVYYSTRPTGGTP